jgi:hypothetical protein
VLQSPSMLDVNVVVVIAFALAIDGRQHPLSHCRRCALTFD